MDERKNERRSDAVGTWKLDIMEPSGTRHRLYNLTFDDALDLQGQLIAFGINAVVSRIYISVYHHDYDCLSHIKNQ